MCGIIGSTRQKINRTHLYQLYHRGPDNSAMFSNNYIHIGHTRLSVIDLKNGNQPMVSSNGRFVLAYNGEIYNYKEIRKELEDNNTKFNTDSDTEVLLKAIEAYGLAKTLPMLNGMFSFALMDNKSNIVYLVRDRMGVKPLFYNSTSGLTFCSEIMPLQNLIGSNNLTIDNLALSLFFNLYYIPSPLTIWNEIKSLLPGHYLAYNINNRESKVVKYWGIEGITRGEKDTEEAESILSNAVYLRMRSDVPYGAFLSGGIDSSVIVKYMSEFSENINTFTAVIKDDSLNEEDYALTVSKTFNTNHKIININNKDLNIRLLRSLLDRFGQPFADSSMLPTYLISNKIAQDVVVALSGDGSDELLAGYDKYRNETIDLKNRFFRNLNLGFLISPHDSWNFLIENLPFKTNDEKEKLRLLDIKYFLEGDVLQKVDRMSAANSLEVRSPFLDHRFVDISNKLPYDELYGNVSKKFLKNVLSKHFDSNFIDRPKVGFMLPIEKWTDKINYYYSRIDFKKIEVFNKTFQFDKVNNGYLRFAILIFSLWYENNVLEG